MHLGTNLAPQFWPLNLHQGGRGGGSVVCSINSSFPFMQLVVASKANPFSCALSKAEVLRQANTSLENLQTSCMDIFYLHAPDHNTPLEETLEAVQQLYTGKEAGQHWLHNY
jgi:diketogulonate reductase-like aldo/keto reductase